VRLLATEHGRVVFVTVNVGEGESLTAAHNLAGELEEQVRQRVAGIADVVVHTEP
jgi:divalent metal cation (Fe/Co/Zn/Cd) transporter